MNHFEAMLEYTYSARDVDYGIVRMYEAHRADLPAKFAVFRELDPALIWLNDDKEQKE